MRGAFCWAVTGTFHGSIIEAETEGEARRIYRTTVNGSTFYFDGEVGNNTSTTYTSTKSDAQVSMGTILHDDHYPPPAIPQLI